MAEIGSNRQQGRSHASERLLAAIAYPERMPVADGPFTLRVDGKEIFVEESAGRLILSHVLTDDGSMVPTLAAYAVGRMLREEATLAFGSLEVSKFRSLEGTASKPLNLQTSKLPGSHIFLWQDASADANDRMLVKLFETFADSCDWWRARVDERGNVGELEISEAVIRP